MPYWISNDQSGCVGWAMLLEKSDGTYEQMACHKTKADAVAHMIAASANTDGEAMGELRAVNLSPPSYMRAAARRGIKLHEEGFSGDGIRPQTVADARKMAAGTVTAEKWRKIGPWIARHLVDLDAPKNSNASDKQYPGAGLVAHLLWGSGPSKGDAKRAMEHAISVVERLNDEVRVDPPAPKKDQIKGSEDNPAGSASGKVGGIVISDATETALKNKLSAHNDAMKKADKPAWTLTTLGALKAVYRRGAGAFSSSHRPGIGRQQWAMARVNAFLVLCRTGKPNNPKYITDNDLLNKAHPKYSGERMYDEDMEITNERDMHDSYRPADSEGVPDGANCGNCMSRDERGMCMRFDMPCEANMYCDAYQARSKVEDAGMHGDDEAEDNDDEMMRNRWVVTTNNNRNIAYSTLEVRAEGDGKTLVGYAAIFDSPSEPLPWTEFVRRGAFAKTINDKADVRLLIDHEGVPLARTKSGTLRISEDDKGLRVEAELDEANPDAARVMSALRRGDVSQMSFAFQPVKDSWSKDNMTRELKEVKLFDVSVVTYPAYEETMVSLRKKQTNNTRPSIVKTSSLALRRAQIAIQRTTRAVQQPTE